MRTEQEMFNLILSYARQDDNVRVVVMNGSRANPNIPKDIFQDFDIVYYVMDPAPLTRNLEFIKYFGELMILQLPDDMGEEFSQKSVSYAYLMQFQDGNRIDLTIYPVGLLNEALASDSLSVLLLDKDDRVNDLPPASDLDYRPKQPTRKRFDDCCIEFWWLNPYVAKALWRGELIHSKYLFDCLLRGELMKMLEWYFGIKTGYIKSMGKQGKFLKKVLDEPDWQLLVNTYPDANFDHIWQSLFLMGDLFRKAGKIVAENFGFSYPVGEDARVTHFLYQVRALPANATSIDEFHFPG